MFRSIITVKADLAQTEFGITGRGIVWAVVCSGVDKSHPHFRHFRNLDLPGFLHHMDYSRFEPVEPHARQRLRYGDEGTTDFLLNDSYRVSEPFDKHGLGTSVAGIIAGQGVYGTDQTIRGLAPEATIVSINVLGDQNSASEFQVLAALRAIQHINEGGRNLLIHGVLVPLSIDWDVANYACGHSPVCSEVDRLVNSGVVVVVPAGNKSYDSNRRAVVEGGITDPGNAELAITAGGSHRTSPHIYGASYFSSRGPTADGRRKPDLLAPEERIITCRRVPAPQSLPRARKGRRARRQVATTESEAQVTEEAYWSQEWDGDRGGPRSRRRSRAVVGREKPRRKTKGGQGHSASHSRGPGARGYVSGRRIS